MLDIVKAPETKSEGNYFWDIHDYEDAHGDSVRELLDLLGIEVKPDGSDDPLAAARGGRQFRLCDSRANAIGL